MGSWRLSDLLTPETLGRLVDRGLLPEEARRSRAWDSDELREVRAFLTGAAITKGEQLTEREIVQLMQDFPGRQPPGRYVERRGRRIRQVTRLRVDR